MQRTIAGAASPIAIDNAVDRDGNPSGGSAEALGIRIRWQAGPLGRGDDRQPPSGAFVEDVVQIAIERMRDYQTVADGRFRCRENALSITHLEEALHWLQARTRAREERGVEGTHNP